MISVLYSELTATPGMLSAGFGTATLQLRDNCNQPIWAPQGANKVTFATRSSASGLSAIAFEPTVDLGGGVYQAAFWGTGVGDPVGLTYTINGQPQDPAALFPMVQITAGSTAPQALGYTLRLPAQDANGWTLIPAAADPTRVGYVDNAAGNDTFNGNTPATAWATPGKGFGALNGGQIDQLYFKCGQTFTGTLGQLRRGGASISQPIVISNYGAGQLPKFNCGSTGPANGPFLSGFGLSNVFVIGLFPYFDVRDKKSPSFITLGSQGAEYTGFKFVGAGANILIEDNMVQYGIFSIIAQAATDPGDGTNGLNNVIIRRNRMLDGYPSESQSIQGSALYVADCTQVYIGENTMDHNGYYEGVSIQAPSIFNHNGYTKRNYNITAENNTSLRAGNYGFTMSADEGRMNMYSVFQGNLVAGCGNGFAHGATIGQNNAGAYGIQNSLISGNLFTLIGHKIWQGGTLGLQSSDVEVGSGKHVACVHNWFIDSGFSGPEFTIGNNQPFVDYSFQSNIVQGRVGENGSGSGIVNGGTGDFVTSGNTLSTAKWAKTLALYDASLGGAGTLEDWAAKCRTQTKQSWNPAYAAAAAIAYITTPVGGTPSPYDGKTVAGNAIPANWWAASDTVTGATFNNVGITAWHGVKKFVNCTFNNCQIVQPPPATQFLACVSQGPTSLFSLGFTNSVYFTNFVVNNSPRGLLIQLQTAWVNNMTKVMGYYVDNILGTAGHNEVFLVESTNGATISNLLVDRVFFSTVAANTTPGVITVDNVAGTNLQFSNTYGQWGGYYGYDTPDTSPANGQVSGLVLCNWDETGGRIQVGQQTVKASCSIMAVTNPTLVGAPAGSPVFSYIANNGQGTVDDCQINGLGGTGMVAQYGFSGTVTVNS